MAEDKEKPLTRKDVLKKIAENGGTAEGLDLSGEVFEEGIDLSDKVLCGIILSDTELIRANFNGSDLDGAVMPRANLQYATFNPLNEKAATLVKADFSGAYLKNAEFRGADLSAAQFQEVPLEDYPSKLLHTTLEETDFRNANLFGTSFNKECKFYKTRLEGACIQGSNILEARLGDADWGNYVIGEEMENSHDYNLDIAEHRYRHLKVWYTQSGYADIAAKFYYREMEARRKQLGCWPNPLPKIRQTLYWLLCGYGEIPYRVVLWGMLTLFSLALIYFLLRGVAPFTLTVQAFANSLYYSAVSFTALGYGPWFSASSVQSWARGVGAAEAIIGVFMIALFLITFVRKMTR